MLVLLTTRANALVVKFLRIRTLCTSWYIRRWTTRLNRFFYKCYMTSLWIALKWPHYIATLYVFSANNRRIGIYNINRILHSWSWYIENITLVVRNCTKLSRASFCTVSDNSFYIFNIPWPLMWDPLCINTIFIIRCKVHNKSDHIRLTKKCLFFLYRNTMGIPVKNKN